MAYVTKEQEQEQEQEHKRQGGYYSVYNFMYKHLMDNYEPIQVKKMSDSALKSLERKLVYIGREYCIKGGDIIDNNGLANDAEKAVSNFIDNNGSHGDTSHAFGKTQSNSFDTIKSSIEDLRW